MDDLSKKDLRKLWAIAVVTLLTFLLLATVDICLMLHGGMVVEYEPESVEVVAAE